MIIEEYTKTKNFIHHVRIDDGRGTNYWWFVITSIFGILAAIVKILDYLNIKPS